VTQFIDRRPVNKNKSAVNRERFIRRYRKQIKKAVSDAISHRKVTDVDSGEKISIPSKDLHEPFFHHGREGKNTRVLPGNKEFMPGDTIARPPQGGGGSGGQASNQGEGEDDFSFTLSRDEYLDLLFEDLELPNLEKTKLNKLQKFKKVRAGFTSDGVPSNINIVRSLQKSLARRIAMQSGLKSQLEGLEKDLENETNEQAKQQIVEEIEEVKRRIAKVPFLDTYDLRYNNYRKDPVPTSQAVMFCVMDVSGSMDQNTKDIAKRFYTLLYLFLTKTYKNIEVVFIRHHTIAKEVDEEEFFYSRETGGTIVSSALHLTLDVIKERFNPSDWNIYVCQASDGDNWHDDSPKCQDLLANALLPQTQLYTYIEITKREPQSLWHHYTDLAKSNNRLVLERIEDHSAIFSTFHKIFKKKPK
tara:strand:- start:13743 stop:14990 length:1248 start_codon:yes stop_codon:yes gene_type:complete